MGGPRNPYSSKKMMRPKPEKNEKRLYCSFSSVAAHEIGPLRTPRGLRGNFRASSEALGSSTHQKNDETYLLFSLTLKPMRNCNFAVEPEANEKLSYSSFSSVAVHEVGPARSDSWGLLGSSWASSEALGSCTHQESVMICCFPLP